MAFVGVEQLNDAEMAEFMSSNSDKRSKNDLKKKEMEVDPADAEAHKVSESTFTSASSSSSGPGLHVYYCAFCGAFALVGDVLLEHLPRRSTDHAFVLEELKHSIKKTVINGDPAYIKRANGTEQQNRFLCKSCGLLVCYKCPNSDYTYILSDALSRDPQAYKRKILQMCGQLPDDAEMESVPQPFNAELNEEEAAAAFAASEEQISKATTFSHRA